MHGRTIAWLNPRQTELIAQIVEAAGLELVGAGGPEKGTSGGVAHDLSVEHIADLRTALTGVEGDLLLIADPGEFAGDMAADDVASILAARERGVRVVTLEPIPPTALDLASGGWLSGTGHTRPIDSLHFCPLTRHNPAYREAADAVAQFGPCNALSVQSWRAPAEGSLGASLFAAMDLILAHMGEPETIDAAYARPAGDPAPTAPPGETLRNLHGTLTANMRFSDGRIAGLIAGDHAGRFNRTGTLIGEAGRLRVFDDGFEWIAPDGEVVDHARNRKRGESLPRSHAVTAIADQLKRILDPALPDPAPTDHAAILALAHAALLSARTGHPESPATVRLMARTE